MEIQLLEELKELLKDVETFMTSTLKRVSLKKEAVNQKNSIVASIKALLQKLHRISGCNNDVDQLENEDADSTELPGECIDEIGPIPAQQLKNPTKVGLLEKKRQQQGFGLQKNIRFCVIKDNVMYYYKNRRDKKQAGAFLLDGYDVKPARQVQDDKKKEYAFELIHPTKRHYQFIAEDQPALNAWVKAVRIATNNPIGEEKNEYETDEEEEERKVIFQKDCDDVFYATPDTTDKRRRIHKKQSIDDSNMVYEVFEDQKNVGDRRPSTHPNDDFGGLYDDVDGETDHRLTEADTSVPSVPPRKYSSTFTIHELVREEPIPPPPSYPPPPMPDTIPTMPDKDPNSCCLSPDQRARIQKKQSRPIDDSDVVYEEIEELGDRRPSAHPNDDFGGLYDDVDTDHQLTEADTSVPPRKPPRKFLTTSTIHKQLVRGGSLPPRPSNPPPPLPKYIRTMLDKGSAQSDFQSIALEMKSRLIKVDVPSVPELLPDKTTDMPIQIKPCRDVYKDDKSALKGNTNSTPRKAVVPGSLTTHMHTPLKASRSVPPTTCRNSPVVKPKPSVKSKNKPMNLTQIDSSSPRPIIKSPVKSPVPRRDF